jgi:hypothetical protein
MKSKSGQIQREKLIGRKTISIEAAKKIMEQEGVEYSDEELQEILDFISNIISITTSHYERIKEKETKVISINTSTHETKSISLHPSKHRRAS